jgi:tryptophan synthase alpha chain
VSVRTVIEKANADGRAALIGYLPVGFPDNETSVAAMQAMVEGGADAVEIGLPYSDPLIDGPVIQRATERALAGGTRTADVFPAVTAVTAAGVPALVMTYWNLVDHYGVERFAADLAAAGGSGLITPDLLPDEGADWISAADRHGLDRVFLLALSSTPERIALTAAASRGFVYATALMGVTGERAAVGAGTADLVHRIKAVCSQPVCMGLGVRDGAQAAEVGSYADGVIVGSAFVRALGEAPDRAAGLAAVRALAQDLAAGVRAARR